jgi:hypothetical protein
MGLSSSQRRHTVAVDVRSAARTRQRAHRARKHQGQITLPVVVDEAALVIWLIDTGRISKDEQEDRAKLAAALSQVVEQILLVDLSGRHV